MLLSRFFYVLLALVVGALLFTLEMAQSMYNRAGERSRGEGLSSDSQVVSWYLKDDARTRSAQLVKFALDADIARNLQKASTSEAALDEKLRDPVTAALKKLHQEMPPGEAFDAVFAVDQHGRVVGHVGYPQANGMTDFELGGYPVVADALHGFIRDDTLVWGRIYRVVARPVEVEAGQLPAGAVIGARVLDDAFARELSDRTGAAVAFYVNGSRTAAGAPEGFQTSSLDQIVSDLAGIHTDADYREKGRSSVRELGEGLSVQYTRLPGEAYELGAGFAVARQFEKLSSPQAFYSRADDKDKAAAHPIILLAVVLGLMVLGLGMTYLEHTRPLHIFHTEVGRLASGQADQMHPSKFAGAFRKLAAEVNEGIDKVAAATGGRSRRATNLEDVLGELPAQPMMAAFAVPDVAAALPLAASSPLPSPSGGQKPVPPGRNLPKPPGQAAPAAPVADPEAEWRVIYSQFVATKQQCGEILEGFTYEKFRTTLVKNRDAIVARHGVTQVKFSVYVKDGKAAVKASPGRV
jgi:hypothetical protein